MKHTLKTCSVLIGLLAADFACGHATIWPRQSAVGAYEKYTIRIPNEKTSPTVRIEAEFPPELTVGYFEAVPGWKIEHLLNADGGIVGAAWDGGSIGPREFAEFALLGVNPRAAGTMVWRIVQVHADGTRSEWIGARESANPAPVTAVS